jgi:hypothetical protein
MDIKINITTGKPPVQLYRVPHDIERFNVDLDDEVQGLVYTGARFGKVRKEIRDAGVARPEIYRCNPDHPTRIAEGHQWLWKNINPDLSNSKWATLLGNELAWTNNTGFPGRRDYVNHRDLDKEYPRFHASLVNGGMILEGIEDGDKIWIKSLLTSDPIPTSTDLLKTHLWSWGVSVIPKNGSINYITRLGIDGTLKRVRVPLLTTQRIWLYKSHLHKLPLGFEPPPTWMIGD